MSVTDMLGLATSIVAIAGAAVAFYGRSKRAYDKTLGSRAFLTERIDRMACGVTEEYVRGLFGPPVFARRGTSYLESVYLTKHAWIRVLYLPEKAALTFSVTITDPKYRYAFPVTGIPGRSMRPIGSGCRFGQHDTEADLVGRAANVGASGGAAYVEVEGGTGAVFYQYYAYAYCDSGFGSFAGDRLIASGLNGFADGVYDERGRYADFLDPAITRRLAPFRAETTINTFAIAPAQLDLRSIDLFVDWDLVRVVSPLVGGHRRMSAKSPLRLSAILSKLRERGQFTSSE